MSPPSLSFTTLEVDEISKKIEDSLVSRFDFIMELKKRRILLFGEQHFKTETNLVYGGQLHMLLSGRYRYDVDNREPIGSRLQKLGVSRSNMYSILLDGEENLPIKKAWNTPSTITSAKGIGSLSIAHFIDYPIFRVDSSAMAFDYFVNLGQLTKFH